jgi:large subunit ribosomal protein L35
MPKIKTHKATAKRFKVTGGGKLLRIPAAGNHLLTNKSDRKNTYLEIAKCDKKRIKRRLGKV